MFGFWNRKRVVEQIKEDTKRGFDVVKDDIKRVSVWIQHLEKQDQHHHKNISEISGVLSSIKKEVDEMREEISMLSSVAVSSPQTKNKRLFKKQLAVYPVQTAVQTAVQTPNFEQFSGTEKLIIWALLNYQGALSYEDLAVLLGKEKSTIRGQINMIRDKELDLIGEVVEKNGKKRVFISEEIKEKMLKKSKITDRKRVLGEKTR